MQLTTQKSKIGYLLILVLFCTLVFTGCSDDDDDDDVLIKPAPEEVVDASGAWEITFPDFGENGADDVRNVVLTQHDTRFKMILAGDFGLEGSCEGRTYTGTPLSDESVLPEEVVFTVTEDGKSLTATFSGDGKSIVVKGKKIVADQWAIYRSNVDVLGNDSGIDGVTYRYYDAAWRLHSTESDTDLDGQLDRATRNVWSEEDNRLLETLIDSDLDGDADALTTYFYEDGQIILAETDEGLDTTIDERTTYVYDEAFCVREVTYREQVDGPAYVTALTCHSYENGRLKDSKVMRQDEFPGIVGNDIVNPVWNEVIYPLWRQF